MSLKTAMEVLKRRVVQSIEDQSDGHFLAKALLQPMSAVYGALVRHHLRRYEKGIKKVRHLPCPVVSIGNLTVGGTGKTPTTVYIARQLSETGCRPAILSRGYKGRLEKKGGIVSDGHKVLLGPEQAGDEPYLMARLLPGVPVVVGADRYAAGRLAIDRFHPQVILLDDGFQHIQLHRDLNLLLMDHRSPLGNGFLLPRGSLREPPEACKRAHAFIYTHWAGPEKQRQALKPFLCGQLPEFRCRHTSVLRFLIPKGEACGAGDLASKPLQADTDWLKAPLFVFSGLARNGSFYESVDRMGGQIVGSMAFNDHHRYTPADLTVINENALASGCQCLVTTDKDYVRLPEDWRLGLDLIVLGVEIDFGDDRDRWERFLLDKLSDMASY